MGSQQSRSSPFHYRYSPSLLCSVYWAACLRWGVSATLFALPPGKCGSARRHRRDLDVKQLCFLQTDQIPALRRPRALGGIAPEQPGYYLWTRVALFGVVSGVLSSFGGPIPAL